ncbi:MAG: CPBP family intramembrane metalloprotease [Cyclobacteriaceae bacterium]|nr:CPBP family intramembrane metalloprotease [Cyclobacteriaceae bacterium HetDA_MAG_MS6]
MSKLRSGIGWKSIIIFIIVFDFIEIFVNKFFWSQFPDHISFQWHLNGFVTNILIISFLIIYRSSTIKELNPNLWNWNYKYLALIPVVLLLSSFFGFIGEQIHSTDSSKTPMLTSLFAANWHSLLVAPLVEEFFYRKVLLDNLRKRYSNWLFIIPLASVSFILAHFTYFDGPWELGILKASMLFIVGCLLGWTYLKSDSYVTVVILHACNNLYIAIYG